MNEQIARYQEIERRGLLDKLPIEKQQLWAEIKQRGLDKPQDSYSTLDKAKYTLRAAGEGATFGLGDLVAGYTNTLANDLADVTHGKDLAARAKGYGKYLLHTVLPLTASKTDDFKQGRKEFVEEQNAFKEEHPWLNAGGEVLGGLTTGVLGAGKAAAGNAAKTGIRGVLNGARVGGLYGGAYGAGSGATENPEEINAKGAVKGFVPGVLLGGAFGGAVPVALGTAGKIGRFFRNIKNKDFRAIEKLAGADAAKSAQEGVPLIDSANEGIMDLALGTKQADPKAAQVYADYARQRLQGQRPLINEMLSNTFGKKGSNQLLDEIKEETLKGSEALYNKAKFQMNENGEILLDGRGKPIGKLIPEFENKLNDYELEHIQKAYKAKGLGREIKGLPQNDMRVLNNAKLSMDDEIMALLNKGEINNARPLQELRAEFIAKIDAANPEYKKARAFYERGKQAEEALLMGRAFDKSSRENALYDFNKLTDEQKKFYRLGMGDRISEHTNVKTEGGNIAQRVFDAETGRRIKLFGVENADELLSKAKKESITAGNLNRLLQGSQTAEKEASIGRWFTNPNRQAKGFLARTIDALYGKVVKPNPQEVARMLTDPRYLQLKQLQAMQGDIGLARRIGKYNFDLLRSGGIIGGDIVANGKSWQHLRKSPDWRTFAGIPKIRHIVEEGKSINNIPNYKARGDNFNGWNYYVKDVETPQGKKTQLVTVGQKPTGNELHGFNPDLIEWAQKNPDKAKDIADFISMRISASDKDGHTNSIVNILKNVKTQKWTKEDRKAIQEILRQAGYKGPVILEQQENK